MSVTQVYDPTNKAHHLFIANSLLISFPATSGKKTADTS